MTGRQKDDEEDTVTLLATLPDGTHVIEHSDGRLERRKSKTDWAALDALTEEEIEASIKDDPDWSGEWNWSDAVLVVPPTKKAISIRLDTDVLDYFKADGAGYQRRINAVLRSYMEQKKRTRRKSWRDIPFHSGGAGAARERGMTDYCSFAFTMALALAMSICPANLPRNTPMTLPISFMPAAPVSATAASMAAAISASLICLGR